MVISDCISDTDSIISHFDTNICEEDLRQNGSKLGHKYFIQASDDRYKQIHDSMMRAAEIFLLSTHRSISDYEVRYPWYKIFKWETPMGPMAQHTDGWIDEDKAVIPDISLVMYFTSDFEGGEVLFNSLKKAFKPKAGDVLVFDSDTLHGVDPVLSGNRITTQLFLFKK